MTYSRLILALTLLAITACAGTTGPGIPEDEYILDPLAMDEPTAQPLPEPVMPAPPPETFEPPPAPPVATAPAPAAAPSVPRVSAVTYRVKKGDTLWAIARTQLGRGSRCKEIASLNGIPEPYVIKVGQELRLP
jgi:nucleoid-associated protein YgaU